MFLSTGDSYCYHEPTADCTPVEWVARAKARPETVVGAIDTGAYRFPNRVKEAIGSTPLLQIVRNIEDVSKSSESAGFHGIDVRAESQRLLAIGCTEFIYYDCLNDISYLRALWSSLIGTWFDEERALALMEMRIQRDARLLIINRPNLDAHLRGMMT